ncbi:flagellar hook-length control protein FliK [Nitrosomonas mobilis]|uniref:Putative flagellar hook-length control protein n=1 Tax=Nitrosomonas mobilis TaxID=51642 RepID=A0A1G5SAS4_9PROT|nr:flagellar hook-length control protein FliK [Nitrosomonas mobilis]SCZ84304.1 putative flagellar hook-length control protein [Nitrosomonas mobilis]
MLNLPLLPISQPASSNASSAISSAAPVTPVSEQPRDQAFSEVLKNTEKEAVAEAQSDITIEPITTDESSVESPVELPVVMSTGTVSIPPGSGIINPAIPLTSGMLSTTIQSATDSFTAQLQTRTSITGQSDFFTSNPSNANTLPPKWLTSPAHSISSKLGQSVFAGTSLLNADADMSTLASKLTEALPDINIIADHSAIPTDSGKSLPLSLSSANPSPAATTSVPMSAALSDPVWPDEFSQKVTWLATERLQTAELKLHPAHLGPIEVLLKISNEQGIQQLTAQFTSQNPLVRETIEANLLRLREAMAESGITLTDTSVGADTPRQDARNPQQTPAHPYPSGRKNAGSIDIQQDSGKMAISQMGIINTFA